jgi:hypothetical protein
LESSNTQRIDQPRCSLSTSWSSFPSFLDDCFDLSGSSTSTFPESHTMGTLSDISGNARRKQARTPSCDALSSASRQSPDHFDNEMSAPPLMISDLMQPRYMTPTMASRAQSSLARHQARPVTPTPSEPATGGRKGWMAKAGRRFGNPPMSRKEGRAAKKAAHQLQSGNQIVHPVSLFSNHTPL